MRKLLCIFYIVAACNSSVRKENLNENSKKSLTTEQFSLDTFLLSLQRYMPDTAISPFTHKEFKDGVRPYEMEFNKFIAEMFDSKKSLTEKEKQNRIFATRLFDDYQQYISFKLAKNALNKKLVVSILGFCSPYSKLVTIEDRKQLFLSFPEEVQKSENGKKTWAILQEFSFLNIGKSLNKITLVSGLDKERLLVNVIEKLNKNGNTLMMFGASWCGPCVEDELSLRDKLKTINLTGLKIIGVSIDEDFEKWASYIKRESIPWDTFVLTEGMNNSIIKFLGFHGVPRCLLIDVNGTILKEHTSYSGVIE